MSATGLGQFILKRFSEFAANRAELTDKWERNYQDFHRISREGEQWKKGEAKDWHSATFVGITYQKVTAAFALICDALLTGGSIPFTLKIDSAFDDGQNDGAWEGTLEQYQKKMEDALEDTDAERALRRCLISALIYGESWTKRVTFDLEKKVWAELPVEGVDDTASLAPELRRFERTVQTSTVPTFEFVPVQQMFWDVESDKLRDCCAIIQRTYFTPDRLFERMGDPLFDAEAIRRAIAGLGEGSGTAIDETDAQVEPRLRGQSFRTRQVRILEYWGKVPRKILADYQAQANGQAEGPEPPDGVETGDNAECLVVMAGDEVILALETKAEDRPFERMLAGEDIDSIGGIGVADNLEDTARVINGIVRAFEDNKRLSANFTTVSKANAFTGKNKVFTPGTNMTLSGEYDRIDDAFKQLVFQDVGDTLISALTMFLSFAEDESGVPKLAQGLPDPAMKTATATEISERASKAQKYLGTIISNCDEMLLEPNLTAMLDQIMAEDAAGARPLHVQALGFNSFMNRVVKLQKMQQFLNIVLSDEELRTYFKISELAREIAKTMDLDPDQFSFTEEERAANQQQKMIEMSGAAAPPAQDGAMESDAQQVGLPEETAPEPIPVEVMA